MKTDDLIIALATSAGPVQPLPRPLVRLARWTLGAALFVALGVLVIHPRADLSTVIREPVFAAVAGTTLVAALLAAAAAFVLSVPGEERLPLQHYVPFVGAGVWALGLSILLAAGGDSLGRLLALPVHTACVAEIVGLALVPGSMLFAMLRRAAPLEPAWSAALATLAAVGLGAVATQLICPIDDPAHQLVGHFAPVAVLVLLGAVVGRRWLSSAGACCLQDEAGR